MAEGLRAQLRTPVAPVLSPLGPFFIAVLPSAMYSFQLKLIIYILIKVNEANLKPLEL